ncbi:hypothetical protein BB561_006148 [Smittium simulii]|uniref:Uncharacterized protein n=1 Tax=Smittium simulii TaxID=133385 RepID=A0A2T9Y6A4_9FUNG|nr:hypothetical protein BB561_006148 [Smittium simulii]
MSGVKYSPFYENSCKTGTSLQNDVNIITESANSVLIDYFDRCNIGETIKNFATKNVDIYLNINVYAFKKKSNIERFKYLANINGFRDIKGITVSNNNIIAQQLDLDYYAKIINDVVKIKNKEIIVGINKLVRVSNHEDSSNLETIAKMFKEYKNYFDYVLLNLYIPESSIDSAIFASKVFNEHFNSLKELQKPIYLQIESKNKKLEDESFLKVLRELECRKSEYINYFMADSFGPNSIFKKDSAYNKFKSMGKDSFDCRYHEYIGNWGK